MIRSRRAVRNRVASSLARAEDFAERAAFVNFAALGRLVGRATP